MSEAGTPKILFGVGATKAGTSWLHSQLERHPECHFRSIKELNYFPTVHERGWDREINLHRKALKDLADRWAMDLDVQSSGHHHRIGHRLIDLGEWLEVLELRRFDPDAYLRYLFKHAGGAAVVGDVTPAYSLLPVHWIERMLSLSGGVRMVFVLRDPLDRLWSHVRMMAARRDPMGIATSERAHTILRRTLAGKEWQIERRSDYAQMLPMLTATVPTEKLLILHFEALMSGQQFPVLCRFLGIEPGKIDKSPVFAGQNVELGQDARRAALEWLRPQYEAAEDFLGILPEGWNSP